MPRRRRLRFNWPYLAALAIFGLAICLYIGVGVGLSVMEPKRRALPQDFKLALIARALDATLAVWFFAVGASIGSFLNVVAYRLPLGRSLGGHSACPFCCTTIAPTDNIPVFAWLRLRGRCRSCHLPISIQYPLVELAVGLAFLSVYFTEFAIAGSNLPRVTAIPAGMGLIWMSVTQTLAVRVLLFLTLLSGLIAAALMLVRHARPPATLFGFLFLVIALGELAFPGTVIVPWWVKAMPAPQAPVLLHVALKLVLGSAAGLLLATVTQTLLRRPAGDIAWAGTLACVGALLGWQAVPSAACSVLIVSLVGTAIVRRSVLPTTAASLRWLSDPVVWAWLGLLIFRANWRAIELLLRGPQWSEPWLVIALTSLTAIALAWLLGQLYRYASPPAEVVASASATEPVECG